MKFFLLIFAISIPFWILGALTEQFAKMLPINLPVSALMFICPMVAAFILAHQENKISGVKELVERVFDYRRITNKVWYVPAMLFMPLTMVASYWLMRWSGLPLPEPDIPVAVLLIFFVSFFIGAICEEIGWTGYAIDPLQERHGALAASVILGAVWGIWHVIPWYQGHPDVAWVASQFAATVVLRVIMVWLYNNTGKSLFCVIIFHTMINVSEYAFPNYGSHFNPFITFVVAAAAAIIIIVLYGARTLAQYRYASPSSEGS